MNYRFEISSEDYPDFKCEIAVGRDQNFLMFHETIVDVLGYDSTQLASFFTLDAMGERVKEIALMDMSDDSEYAVLVMDQTLIGDAINSKCLELEYVYDFFENRSLRIEYAGEYIADSGDVLPKLISCTGEIPEQFEFESEGGWDSDDEEDDFERSYMDEFSRERYDEGEEGFGDEEYGDWDDESDAGGRRRDAEYDNIDDYIDQL